LSPIPGTEGSNPVRSRVSLRTIGSAVWEVDGLYQALFRFMLIEHGIARLGTMPRSGRNQPASAGHSFARLSTSLGNV